MRKIDCSPKNLKHLLQNTKYSINYYQREYMWQRKHIEELIDDLTSEFLDSYELGHERAKVADYGAYYMGSIVLTECDKAIIDGQQRLSSLTLILMYLNNRLKCIGKSHNTIETMIYSELFGEKSFNINIEDRQECMDAIFNSVEDFDTTYASDSVRNLYGRFQDICELFPNDITDDMLLHFCDWIVEKVIFIEIVATTEQDAYKVFITMNDRGLNLTPAEMLKGYILSRIESDTVREDMNKIWKETVSKLKKEDNKADDTFIKTWLRAHYAETIRDNKAGAVNKDFDIIGGSFHKWVRDESVKLGLQSSKDYELFMRKFEYFASIYIRIREAEKEYADKYKCVFSNAQVDFTFQPQLLLAPICFGDSPSVIDEKINLVASFIDVMIISRVIKNNSVKYDTIKNNIFNITKDIRMIEVPQLKMKLKHQYDTLLFDPESALPEFRLNQNTKKYIKNILARIIGYIEERTDVTSHYSEYMHKGKNPYEIEHIISDHFGWFSGEYTDQDDFRRWRNSIGALLLLHKSINASLNDSMYEEKLVKYCSNEGNIYSESLGEVAYKNNPKFKRFIEDNCLGFEPYAVFGKNEISKRITALTTLFKLIWNDEMFI